MAKRVIQKLYLYTRGNKIIAGPDTLYPRPRLSFLHYRLLPAAIMLLLMAACTSNPAIKEVARGGDTLVITPGNVPDRLRARLTESFFSVYPRYREHFNKAAPRKIFVTIKEAEGMRAQGAAAGHTIHLFISKEERDYGQSIETFCHELMHILQRYPGAVDRWIKEGMADYANFKYGIITDAWRIDSFANTPRTGILWSSGYQHSAKFFMWLDTIYPQFTLNLNEACLKGNYPDTSYFSVHAGRPLPELWADYISP